MAQSLLGGRSGYATENTCKVMLGSLYPGDAALTVNGARYPVEMIAVGADRSSPITFNGGSTSTAGYVGAVTVNGLDPNAPYAWSAAQGSRDCLGQLRSAPRATDDFTVFKFTCSQIKSHAGLFYHIKKYCERGPLPVAALLHIDDYDYLSAFALTDTAGSGHASTDLPITSPLEYNYALAMLAQMGLLWDETQSKQYGWNGETRLWLERHANRLFQWGDQDIYNNIGWTYGDNSQAAYPNAKSAFQKIWGLTNPPLAQNRDTKAIPWAATLGPLRVVAMDGNSNGNTLGSANANLPPAHGGSTADGMTIYGNNQVDDVLDASNTSNPFKLLLMMNSIRALTTPANAAITGTGCGANHPLFDAAPAEYARLFTRTGATPKSLMDNPNTNGTNGQLVALLGDHHLAAVLRNQAAAYAGNAAESFLSLCSATVTGSNNIGQVHSSIRQDVTYNGSIIEFLEGNGSYATGGANPHCVQIDVYGSRSPKEMHVTLRNHVWQVAGRWVWKQGQNGNLPVLAGGMRMAA